MIPSYLLTNPALCNDFLLAQARPMMMNHHTSRRSNVAYKTFEKIQEQLGVPQHSLIQDEPTRWNSSFYMLERLLEQRVALTAANAELSVPTELRIANGA